MPLTLDILEKARQKRETASKGLFSSTTKPQSPKSLKISRTATVYKAPSENKPSPAARPKSPAANQMMQHQLDLMKRKYSPGSVFSLAVTAAKKEDRGKVMLL